MGSYADELERIRAKYVVPATAVPTPVDAPVQRALVMESQSGRTVITAPASREVAYAHEAFLYLHGRFVEAEHANANGAFWSTADLQMGEPTVAGGPLNWLHEERKVIGALLTGDLVKVDRQASASGAVVGNHIASTAAVWRFLYPEEARTIEKAAADRQLFYSMECVSREVECVDGCGASFPYATYITEKAKLCEHLREHSSTRRFVDPVFLGGAIIVPPIRPGWANADVEVVKQAAAATEQNDLSLDHKQAAALAEQILMWANRE